MKFLFTKKTEDWKSRLPRKMVYNGHNEAGTMGRRVPPSHGYEDDNVRDEDGRLLLEWWTETDDRGNNLKVPCWINDGRYERK